MKLRIALVVIGTFLTACGGGSGTGGTAAAPEVASLQAAASPPERPAAGSVTTGSGAAALLGSTINSVLATTDASAASAANVLPATYAALDIRLLATQRRALIEALDWTGRGFDLAFLARNARDADVLAGVAHAAHNSVLTDKERYDLANALLYAWQQSKDNAALAVAVQYLGTLDHAKAIALVNAGNGLNLTADARSQLLKAIGA